MTEQEFKIKYLAEKKVFYDWGEFIKTNVSNKLISSGYKIDDFLKVPCITRVKEVDSIIGKAFYRGKQYGNPYDEITDKVGIRFVVLFQEEINIIELIINDNEEEWEISKDRDFEEEKLKKPTEFVYQSQHYIIKNKIANFNTNNSVIPIGTPCEVQIRTLLQHAYSELTHDKIYKPSFKVPPELHRFAARSMALIEATDEIFSKVNTKLSDIMENRKEFIMELYKIYNDASIIIEPKINEYFLDIYEDVFKEINIEDVVSYYNQNSSYLPLIKEKANDNLLFRQPIILFLYYLFDKKRMNAFKFWPFERERYSLITNDLGINQYP